MLVNWLWLKKLALIVIVNSITLTFFCIGATATAHSQEDIRSREDYPIWLSQLDCTGNEDTLFECRSNDCHHDEDVIVQCSKPDGMTTTVVC